MMGDSGLLEGPASHIPTEGQEAGSGALLKATWSETEEVDSNRH